MSKFLPILLLVSTCCIAQVSFEKSVLRYENGQEKTGYVKNLGWSTAPKNIEFKESQNGNTETISTVDLLSLEIGTSEFYKNFDIQIDKSTNVTNTLDNRRRPNYVPERALLKRVQSGDINLFVYAGDGLRKYFYQVGDAIPVQLFYKRYMNNYTLKIGEIETYKQQLKNLLNCDLLNDNTFANIQYNESSLSKLFDKYYACNNTGSARNGEGALKTLSPLNFKIKVGVQNASLNGTFINSGSMTEATIKGDDNINLRLGLELEYILPFGKNKWGIFFEPMYQKYAEDGIFRDTAVSFSYSSIEITTGVRHYFFTSPSRHNAIFINAGFLIDAAIEKDGILNRRTNQETNSGLALNGGIGYKYGALSGEIRYNKGRNLFSNNFILDVDYSSISFNLGYQF